MRADRADQFRSTAYGKVLSRSRFDSFLCSSWWRGGSALAGEHDGGPFAIRSLMIWNGVIYCTPVVRDNFIVSLH